MFFIGIKETLFLDKSSILCFSACEEDSIIDDIKIGIVEIEGITDSVEFVLKTYAEAVDFIIKLREWKYGK